MTRREITRRALGAAAALGLSACAGAQETAPLPPARAADPAAAAAATAAEEATPLPPVSPAGFEDWRARFRARALAEGIRADIFEAAFAGIEVNPRIVELDRAQPEFTRQIWDYLDRAVSDSRIANGREGAVAQAETLAAIEAAGGVDRGVLVAVWGLESAYGFNKGSTPVIEGLATLSFDGRRRAFFEPQLMAALRILQSGVIAPSALVGSWAGAMGHTQLLPGNYLRYGTDQDGDGRIDVWGEDPADALASTATYFKSFGWERGQPAVRRVRLPEGFDFALASQSIRRPVADWQGLGVTAWDGGALPASEAAAVLLPAGAAGPAWLAYPNFRVIKAYNNATAYALAVALLAEEVAGRRGASRDLPWPRGDRALSRDEKSDLQARLTALGFDTKGIDGRIGPNSRAAVRAFQAAEGLVADGYVNEALLRRVRAAGG